MALNLTVVATYAVNVFFRVQSDQPALGPVWASAFALVLLAISGWPGGRMVYQLGVGVSASGCAPRKDTERPGRMASRGT